MPATTGLDLRFGPDGSEGVDSGDDGAIGLPPQPSYHHHTTSMSDFGTGSGPSIQFTPEDIPEVPDSQSPGPEPEPGIGLDLPPQYWGGSGRPPPPEDKYEEGDSVLELLDDDDAPTVVS